jgi:hypothetical protein
MVASYHWSGIDWRSQAKPKNSILSSAFNAAYFDVTVHHLSEDSTTRATRTPWSPVYGAFDSTGCVDQAEMIQLQDITSLVLNVCLSNTLTALTSKFWARLHSLSWTTGSHATKLGWVLRIVSGSPPSVAMVSSCPNESCRPHPVFSLDNWVFSHSLLETTVKARGICQGALAYYSGLANFLQNRVMENWNVKWADRV